MLHLIWQKDNSSTSEDGKEIKGVRSRLLECYRSLYFDPIPDMEPKQQVNRIAKNMIEYVSYLFTESLRYSCNSLVTDKHTTPLSPSWLVWRRWCESWWKMVKSTRMLLASFGKSTVSCSRSLQSLLVFIYAVIGSERPLPRPQRRGAVIILGMLALAKRSVVSERVEVLVKIGLGNLGKVRVVVILRVIWTDSSTGWSNVSTVHMCCLTTFKW